MNCDRVRLLLNGYVDGELDLVNALDIEQHLQGCASCSRRYEELLALHTAVNDPRMFYSAPAGLQKRIHVSLKGATPASPVPWRRLSLIGSLAGVVIVVLIIVAGGWLVPRREAILTQEVQSAYVRSMMTNHMTDVASSDQHTVKPWFSGKLDYSPPVVDLSAQGYPLIGGRLDYLDGRPVAALVYQRDKHVINLFIWPTTTRSNGSYTLTYRGYNLYQWAHSGMTYWAVSDLNTNELQSFVALIQKMTE